MTGRAILRGPIIAHVVCVDCSEWWVLVAALLLIMALSSALLRRLPVSTALIYLGFGLLIGPLGMGCRRREMVTGPLEYCSGIQR